MMRAGKSQEAGRGEPGETGRRWGVKQGIKEGGRKTGVERGRHGGRHVYVEEGRVAGGQASTDN